MAIQALSNFVPLLFIMLMIKLQLHGTAADYGGWENAHATFYGGGDASGTMGKSKMLPTINHS